MQDYTSGNRSSGDHGSGHCARTAGEADGDDICGARSFDAVLRAF